VNKKKIIFVLLIFFLTAAISSVSYAQSITLTDAVLNALDNNIELKEKANEVADLKKDLEIIRAEQSWNIEFSGEYDEIISEAQDSSLRSTNDNLDQGLKTALNINKEFSSGLKINQQLNYSEAEQENYYISFSQPLIPITESSLEQEYFIKSRELLKSESEYINLKENKVIDWLESYLNILRLIETRNNLEKSVERAFDFLEDQKRKAELNEAGKSDVFTAEIAYLDAEKNYYDIEAQLLSAKNYFALNLGLDSEQELLFDGEAELLNFMTKNIIKDTEKSGEDLYNDLLINDKELKVQQLSLRILEKNLAWQQDDSKINLDLNGSFDQQSEESIVGLNFSYDLFDGGAAELREKKILEDIDLQIEQIAVLKKDKLLQLKSLLNNIESAERSLKRNDLALSREKLELDIKKEQYNDGSAVKSEVLAAEIDYYISLNDYNKSKDKLLIEKINLVKMINDDILNTKRWRDDGE